MEESLPETLEEFFLNVYFEDSSGSGTRSLKYSAHNLCSENALMNGRPLDTALIILGGSSGAGKSTLLNRLFDDDNLCPTNSSKSETTEPVIITKHVTATLASSRVKGKLSFVDVPGSQDTDSENDAFNFAKIQNFLDQSPALKSRSGYANIIPGCRQNVYPNLVLFVINASDNRIAGKNSKLTSSLIQLKSMEKLLDFNNSNLIIVLTHACSLGTKESVFSRKLAEKVASIRSVALKILGIDNVDVVPVENEPDDYDMEKVNDFYRLPNGELSHYNLCIAMKNHFKTNNDLLGRLLVARYLNPHCPERKDAPKIKRFEAKINDEDLRKAELVLRRLENHMQNVVTPYTFQSLGYGYDPVLEEVKPINLLNGDRFEENESGMKEIHLGNSNFLISNHIQAYTESASCFERLSLTSKQEYENKKARSYGLGLDIPLVVNASSDGRWIQSSTASHTLQKFTVAQEIKIAKLKIENPLTCLNNVSFQEGLLLLPDSYTDETRIHFERFFAIYGTHLIHEESLGGMIRLDCVLGNSEIKTENLSKISANLEIKLASILPSLFKNLVIPDTSFAHENNNTDLKNIGVNNIHLKFVGGDVPLSVTYDNLKSDYVNNWLSSVQSRPSELRQSIKLFPFYHLVEGNQYAALLAATKEYLSRGALASGELTSKHQSRQVFSENEIGMIENIVQSLQSSYFATLFSGKAVIGILRCLVQAMIEEALGTTLDEGWMNRWGDDLSGLYDELRNLNSGFPDFVDKIGQWLDAEN